MRGVRSLLLVCVSFSYVAYTQRKVIYDFRTKFLKLFVKHASVLWTVIAERGFLFRAEGICIVLQSP